MTYYLAMWDSADAADARNDDHDDDMINGAEPHGCLLLDVTEPTIQRVLAQAYKEEVADMHDMVEDGPPPEGAWAASVQVGATGYRCQFMWTPHSGGDPQVCVVIREVTPL